MVAEEAAPYAKKVDAFDIGGFQQTNQGKRGFRPVARVKFADEYAPKDWNYQKLGRPDNVVMVKDPEGKSGLLEIPEEGGYNAIRDKVPVMGNDEAFAEQARLVKMLELSPRGDKNKPKK